MEFTEAQQLFTLIFAIHFTLIIDRVHRNYNPYDTYNAWKGKSHAINRLLVSWLIMYIFPLLNFAAFFIILGIYNISFEPDLHGALNIVLVGLLSFFDFGYYRIFEVEKSHDFLNIRNEVSMPRNQRFRGPKKIENFFWGNIVFVTKNILYS